MEEELEAERQGRAKAERLIPSKTIYLLNNFFLTLDSSSKNRQRQDLANEFDELTERLDESSIATLAQVFIILFGKLIFTYS